MKKLVLASILGLGLAATVYGQGTILIGNIQNGSSSPTATSGGLVFVNGALLTANVGIELKAGTSDIVIAPTFMGGTYWGTAGQFMDPGTDQSYAFTRVLNGVPEKSPAAITLDLWVGDSYATYAAAKAAGAPTAEVVFNQTTGGPTAPAVPPGTLTSMPGVNLLPVVPEPTTFALAGLGAAALLVFRRRK